MVQKEDEFVAESRRSEHEGRCLSPDAGNKGSELFVSAGAPLCLLSCSLLSRIFSQPSLVVRLLTVVVYVVYVHVCVCECGKKAQRTFQS